LVWEKEFFEIELITHYLSPEGYVSLKKPKEIEIPNPQKERMIQQLLAAEDELQKGVVAQGQALGEVAEQELMNPMESSGELKEQATAMTRPNIELGTEIEKMRMAIMEMPDIIPAFIMTLENDTEVMVSEYAITKQKRCKTTLVIEDKIIKTSYEPCDVIPIIPFHFSMFRNPYKTYGVIHYIKDVEKAKNKLWGLLIYDMQLRASLRVIYPNTAVADPQKAERQFAVPGAWVGFDADPSLPNSGEPKIVDVSNANQAIIQILSLLQQLAEYITGIFGVVQGNPSEAPGTFGGTQALQTFGTQRIKLASRNIEAGLSLLGYVMVCYLQRYCPEEKIAELLGEGYDPSILYQTTNTKFKVRTQISQTLPTSRQLAANALTNLAGQLGDPQLQQVLTQYALRFLDIQEADEIAETIDVVQQLRQQLAQVAEQIEQMQSEVNSMKNNLLQKDMAIAKTKGQAQVDIAVNKQKSEIENSSPQEDSLDIFGD